MADSAHPRIAGVQATKPRSSGLFARWKPAAVSLPLDAALSGSLPCITCGYELKGLSVSGSCPECGTAVRATILYTVDPEAEELKPLPTPRFTSVCLLVWPLGAAIAALAGWAQRLSDVAAGALSRIPPDTGWLMPVVFGGVALSGLAMTGLIRPVRGTPRWQSLAAIGAMAAYLVLLWSVLGMGDLDAGRRGPAAFDSFSRERTVLEIVRTACIVVVLTGVRPNARDLVKRSLALRTGRVDRQTILAMTAAAVLVLMGYSAQLLGARTQAFTEQGAISLLVTLAIALGNLFITVGIISAINDGWRIAKAILTPPPSVRELITPSASLAPEPSNTLPS